MPVRNMPTRSSSSVPAAYVKEFGGLSRPPAQPQEPRVSRSPMSDSSASPCVTSHSLRDAEAAAMAAGAGRVGS